jgi:hypothetical protein
MEVLIQPAPGRHPGFLSFAVECGVRQLDAQGDVVDRHAEEVLEEDDAGLAPGDLCEIADTILDESVDQPVGLGLNLRS